MAKRTPMKAIRAKCIDCSCGSMFEVRICPIEDCPLYEYRLGKRPPKDNEGEKTLLQDGFSDLEVEGDKSIEEDATEGEPLT